MNEEQKQAVANAKIKLANIWFSGAPDGARGWIGVSLDAVEALAPHAHTSVQNGTADDVYVSYWRG